jgi:uncharacterized membrane protein
MAFTVEQTIIIDRPVQEVWDYIMAHNEWRRPAVLAVRKVTDGPDGVGSRYENTLKMPLGTSTVVNEVTVFDPPGQISWRQPEIKGPVGVAEGRNFLEPAGNGRRFTLKIIYETPGLWRLLQVVARRQLETSVFPAELQQLRATLEGSAGE